jgi:ATP-binding cassette subfamily F protein uup
VSRPTLAILDEPTNHLDIETIEWLEHYLVERFEGAVLLITHDRYLLDRVATRTYELDAGVLHRYEGGYEAYLEAKAERQAFMQRTEANRQNFLRGELEWLRRQPKARSTKQKARIGRAEAVLGVEAPTTARTATVEATATRSGRTVLELVDLSIELEGRTLVDDLTLALTPGERVGVVGRNGTGKTTLLRVILGERDPSRGEVRTGKNTRFAYLDQTRSSLREEDTVFDAVAQGRNHVALGGRTMDMRIYLEQFSFDGTSQRQQIASLSGGERARVALAKMLADPANLLVLDEPTNDLDVATLGALESMLTEYGGTALVVTHDRYFLDRVATNILAFEGDGKVIPYVGNYSSYRALRDQAESLGPEMVSSTVKAEPAAPVAKKRSGLTYAERLELGKLEQAIEPSEDRVRTLEDALGDPETYAAGPDKGRALAEDLAAAKAELERLMTRWEQLEARRE